MKLGEYLEGAKISQVEFARRINRSVATVSRLVRGQQRPDWDTMQIIKAETGGGVMPNDFDPESTEAAPASEDAAA